MMKRKRRKLWAMFMAAALVVTQLPAVAMAEDNVPEDKVNFAAGEREDGLGRGSIASFEPLPGGVAKQTVDVGTELSALNLPDTVTATIYHVTEDALIEDEDAVEDDSVDSSTASSSNADESVSGTSGGDSSEKGGGGTVTTVTTTEEEIPVTWGEGEPAYDGNTEGRYVFTAAVGGYVLSGGAEPPQITVDVVAKVMRNGVMPPINGTLEKTITGWSFVDADFLSGDELALPGVNMDNQADLDTVVSMLPTQISGTVDRGQGGGASVTLDITWSCPKYKKDGEGNWPLTGEYTFTAELPKGYTCDSLPTVKVLLGGANTYAVNNTITEGGLTVAASEGGEVEYTEGSGFTLKASGAYKISGTWNGNLNAGSILYRRSVIKVPDGVTASVVLDGVTIDVSGTTYGCAFSIEENGTANITLFGTNILTSSNRRSGLEVLRNAIAAIDGSGSLTANGGIGGAGIGGIMGSSSGTITINGGTVEANGGIGGAGIGGSGGSSDGTITITINGGTVEANGGTGGAGIGNGESGMGATITINGGTVEANGDSGGAGIGGGDNSIGGTITINGGTVEANGSGRGAGIGRGANGTGAIITINGNAIVFAKSGKTGVNAIERGTSTLVLTDGVVFEGNDGTVYGSPELPGDLNIPNGSTLTVPSGSTLTIPNNTTVTNHGGMMNHGTIQNSGTVHGSGTITNNGTVNDHSNGITVSVTGTRVNRASEIIITFWKDGQELTNSKATAGDILTVQAKVAQKRTRLRSAAPDQVIFKTETAELGAVDVINGTATISLTLTGAAWTPGSYTITAEYGGGVGMLPNDTGSAVLIVEAPSYTIIGGSGGGDSSYTNPDILHGTWSRTDAGVWMFRLRSGSFATSRWGLIDGLWYYFDHEGKMLTGGYFDPAYQSWFYLDTSGAMVTGWKEISGKWYCFYGNGAMAVNAEVDGYKLGPDGAWEQ